MASPVDYSMCTQTVTVYRIEDELLHRYVLPGCFLQWREEQDMICGGQQRVRKFLLIQPGERQQVFAGDRVYEGIGPRLTMEQWKTFLPDITPGLGIVQYATAYHHMGAHCHTEAGRR